MKQYSFSRVFGIALLALVTLAQATPSFANPHSGRGRGNGHGRDRDHDRDWRERENRRERSRHWRNHGQIRTHRGRTVFHPHQPWIIRQPSVRITFNGVNLDVMYRDRIRRGEILELGSAFLSHQQDHEMIPVRECGLRRIQLSARRNHANIDRVVVFFSDGDTDELEVRSFLAEGSHSGWLDLPGYRRCVSAISLIGDTEGSRYDFDQAEIEVFGLR